MKNNHAYGANNSRACNSSNPVVAKAMNSIACNAKVNKIWQDEANKIKALANKVRKAYESLEDVRDTMKHTLGTFGSKYDLWDSTIMKVQNFADDLDQISQCKNFYTEED